MKLLKAWRTFLVVCSSYQVRDVKKTQTSLVSLLQFIINVLKVLRTVGLRRDYPLALAVNKSAPPLPLPVFFFIFFLFFFFMTRVRRTLKRKWRVCEQANPILTTFRTLVNRELKLVTTRMTATKTSPRPCKGRGLPLC